MRTLNFAALPAAALLLGAAIVACDRAPSAPAATAEQTAPALHTGSHNHGSEDGDAGPTVTKLSRLQRKQLAELRQATATYREGQPPKAPFVTRLTDCMENKPLGGMGVHFGDLTRFDATSEHTRPEILVYEQQKDGRLRLVAVEFAVPFDKWTSPKPPELFGLPFHRNETFQLWVLHAWVWKENPKGIFKDWNPKVSCPVA